LNSFDRAIIQAGQLSALQTTQLKTTQLNVHQRLLWAKTDQNAIECKSLNIDLPSGRRLLTNVNWTFQPGKHVLITGTSGSGKSTLFRVISGIWIFGSGSVHLPAHASVMILPQKHYIAIGTLSEALAYPSMPDVYSDEDLKKALINALLPDYADKLDNEDNWNQSLSGGEQQRLAVARALLAQPQWLFMDEATAALDETLEQEIYKNLVRAIPDVTLVSIGHRASLRKFHQVYLNLKANEDKTFTLEQEHV
jgi:putative ATP-binding cassette transporter